jgi:septin family protein
MQNQAGGSTEKPQADLERFNLMVVGESGLGKSTCIQTLIESQRDVKDFIVSLRSLLHHIVDAHAHALGM